MFWARTAALRPLLDLHLSFDAFPEEQGQTDGTLAHAIERLYFLACEHAGFAWMKITAKGELHDQGGVAAVTSAAELSRFLTQKRIYLSTMRETVWVSQEPAMITSPPPKPRRVLHVLWRHALGEGLVVPTGLHTVVILRGPASRSASLVRDAQRALRDLPSGGTGHVMADAALPANEALAAAVASGAALVLLLDRPGVSASWQRCSPPAHGACASRQGPSSSWHVFQIYAPNPSIRTR